MILIVRKMMEKKKNSIESKLESSTKDERQQGQLSDKRDKNEENETNKTGETNDIASKKDEG